MADIFLSYNREDAAIARTYADALEHEGFAVWWDTALRSGEAYDQVTEAALHDAMAVVVLWSERSVVSRWVRSEATVADRNNTLMPVMIEDCQRPVMFELTQTADLIGWNGSASMPAWRSFVEDIRAKIASNAQGGGQKESAAPSAPVSKLVPAAPANLTLPDKPSIAVMPFVNLVGGQEDDYFSDGMAVEVVTALSRFQSLFVISSGSTLSYRGDNRPPSEIARELGVRYVMRGSVRKAGQQVRIVAELLDEVALSPIWTQSFNGILDDIFALQDEVSNAVASQIEPSITAQEVQRAAASPTHSNTAYDLYLRGTHAFWELWTKDSLTRAAELYKRSVEADPNFALAQAYASHALINCVLQGHADDPVPMMQESAVYAHAAQSLGHDDAEVLALSAYTLFQCEEPLGTIDDLLDRALSINPGMSICHYTAGYINLYACRSDEALAAYDRALRLDPRTPWRDAIQIGRAQALVQLERYAEALPIYARAEIAFPEVAGAIRRIVALCHLAMGDTKTAFELPGVNGPVTPNEEFLITRYRDPSFRQRLRDGIAMLIENGQ